MMKLIKFLNETKDIVYYHGTSNEDAAKKISKEGIKGRDVQGKSHLAPVAGRVYLTTDIEYALIYALGGVMMGTDIPEQWIKESKYGYVFVIENSQLKDAQPDEDNIGELIYKKEINWLNDLAINKLTTRQYDKVMDGEYDYWASSGKKILKILTPLQKKEIMQHTKNVASLGSITPSQVWRIDKTKSKQLKKDGSNFFKIAKRVKMGNIK